MGNLKAQITEPQPDLTEAQRLLDEGFEIVRLHNYTKRPIGNDWNKHPAEYIAAEATGYGLPLATNRLCSIDPDHVEMARAGLKAWGFDLDELLEAGVRTRSTRPNSGGRSAFAEDPEEMARWLAFRVFDDEGNSTTVLELRAKSANLQDCIPGVVYSDTKTGQIYSQEYANGKRFDDEPSVPDEFARLWRYLSIDDEALREYERKFYEGIVAAGFMVNGKKPVLLPSMGSGEKLAFSAPGYEGDYNRWHSVPDIFEVHGYRYHDNLDRWSHPGATGAPGIRPIPGKDGLWRSDHAGDPLHGTFSAWQANVQLNHKGDVEAAKAAYDEEKKAAIAAYDFDVVGEDGTPIRLSSAEAQSLAWQINQEVMRLLDLSKGDDQAAKVAADPVAIDGMINGAFWSGSASKVFMLTEQESLNRFTEKDSIKFLLKRFGKILDRAAVEARVEQLDLGGEPGSLADIERRRKLVNAVMATPNSVIIDHLKYHNQRDSIEWRVDMFATQSRLELLEDKARIVLTHKPFKEAAGGYDQEVVNDYKQHFTRFDEFLKFLVMARFALDRKKAYLWLLADSDWGKGFLIDGILGQLEAKVETSIKEIEAVFEGKPVGRSPEEFKRAFALVVDEFKTVKSEIKQLQSRLSLAPKFQLTSSVEIFAKVFMSAESVASLVTENGVEDQFANRMSIFVEKGTIESRPLFNSKGKPAYRAALVAYAAEFMNEEIDAMRLLGEEGAQDSAEKWLSGFIGRNGLDTIYERFSDSLERVAMDAIEYLHRLPFDNHSMLKDVPSDTWHLKNARKMLDKFLEDTFDHSEVGAYRKRKDEILVHMSADGKGSASHRVNGRVCKCVMLKKMAGAWGAGGGQE